MECRCLQMHLPLVLDPIILLSVLLHTSHASNLRSLTLFIVESRCQVRTSITYASSGLRRPETILLSLIRRICTALSMLPLLATSRHGNASHLVWMSMQTRTQSHHGRQPSMMFTSVIPESCFNRSWPTPTSVMKSICHPSKCLTRMTSDTLGTLYRVIGPGDRR